MKKIKFKKIYEEGKFDVDGVFCIKLNEKWVSQSCRSYEAGFTPEYCRSQCALSSPIYTELFQVVDWPSVPDNLIVLELCSGKKLYFYKFTDERG